MAETKKLMVDDLMQLAGNGEWATFDEWVRENSDNPEYFNWAANNLDHSEENGRDLAISILEYCSNVLPDKTMGKLRDMEKNESESLHIRRKAAIALFRHGDRRLETLQRLREAIENDLELADQCMTLLDKARLL